MCGIAGIHAYAESAPAVELQALKKVHNHLSRRGPDGQGQWRSSNGRTALCHRRLAIIDLSAQAAQPMADPKGRTVISYNGELYNYLTLRRELETKGYCFRSHSDTEVLLHLYRDRGQAMLQDLSGMFAFALWDEDRQGLLLARDPYGIKPLYYADDGNTLRFASQVKALLAGGGIDTRADGAGLAGFYLFGSVPEPYTLYRGITALAAGNSLWVDRQGLAPSRQYFSIAGAWTDAGESASRQPQITAQPIRDALCESVDRHRVSDVPVGCFLSAGIDSGALLGLLTQATGAPVQTVTLAFSEFAGSAADEAPLAERTARYYGARHTTRRITEEEFQADLPAIFEAMDQPSIDGINTWFVSKAAAELGLKVAISGLGGDELFAGYPGFRSIPHWVRCCSLPAKVPVLGAGIRKLAMRIPGLNPKAPGMLEYAGSYAGAYLLKRGLFMPWELDQLMDSELLTSGLQTLQPVKHINAQIDVRHTNSYVRIASLEACLYLRNQLLRDADWAGMAHGLEIRTPLVDTRLLLRLAPLLSHLQPGQSKRWLACAPTKSLPDDIVNRSKTGFQTPLSVWLRHIPQGRLPGPAGHPALPPRWHWSRHWAVRVGNAFRTDR